MAAGTYGVAHRSECAGKKRHSCGKAWVVATIPLAALVCQSAGMHDAPPENPHLPSHPHRQHQNPKTIPKVSSMAVGTPAFVGGQHVMIRPRNEPSCICRSLKPARKRGSHSATCIVLGKPAAPVAVTTLHASACAKRSCPVRYPHMWCSQLRTFGCRVLPRSQPHASQASKMCAMHGLL